MAVQDDLAVDVTITIQKLQTAGIHVWILTGDKAVTAEAVARSAGLIRSDQSILRLTARDCEDTSITSLIETLQNYISQGCSDPILIDEHLVDLMFMKSRSPIPSHSSSNPEGFASLLPSENGEESVLEVLRACFMQSLCNAPSVIIARMRKDQKQLITERLKDVRKQVCSFRESSWIIV